MNLSEMEFRLLLTSIVLVVYVVVRLIMLKVLRKFKNKFSFSDRRYKSQKKIFLLLLLIVAIITLLVIWGVDESQLLVFLSSVFTVFGIAFIAKWSILSNITASFILFFNHPIKIGERICILDKDFNLDGVISDIGIFYLHLKMENNEVVAIPTNIFLDKMIKTFES